MRLLLSICILLTTSNVFSASIQKKKGLKALVLKKDVTFNNGDSLIIESEQGDIKAIVIKVKESRYVIKANSSNFQVGDIVRAASESSFSHAENHFKITGLIGKNVGLEGLSPLVFGMDLKYKPKYSVNVMARIGVAYFYEEIDITNGKSEGTSMKLNFGGEYLIPISNFQFGIGATLGYEILKEKRTPSTPGIAVEEGELNGPIFTPLIAIAYIVRKNFSIGAEVRYGLRFARDIDINSEIDDLDLLATVSYSF